MLYWGLGWRKGKPTDVAHGIGPLTAGPSRSCIQQVLSYWASGTAGWGGEVYSRPLEDKPGKVSWGREGGNGRSTEWR